MEAARLMAEGWERIALPQPLDAFVPGMGPEAAT